MTTDVREMKCSTWKAAMSAKYRGIKNAIITFTGHRTFNQAMGVLESQFDMSEYDTVDLVPLFDVDLLIVVRRDNGTTTITSA